MTKSEQQSEALYRAQSGQSMMNYGAIIQGFMDKGISANDILPRENVLTFNAWRALGRTVKKGEHGIKVVTFVPMTKTETAQDGTRTESSFRRPKTTTVFHISQTCELGATETKAAPKTDSERAAYRAPLHNADHSADRWVQS